jgi:hypothetical protein
MPGLKDRFVIALAAIPISFLATTSGASAAIIDYTFEPGTDIVVFEANPPFNLYSEAITGSFAYNTLSRTVSAVDITLTGSPSYFGTNPITFLYAFSPFNSGDQAFGFAYAGTNNNSSYLISLEFNGLGGASSPLGGGAFYNGQGGNNAFSVGTSGGVTVGATPIPAALPLFAGGLGLMGFVARRRKRKASVAA